MLAVALPVGAILKAPEIDVPVVIDLAPPPERVKLLYVTAAIVCALAEFQLTVPVPAVNVPPVPLKLELRFSVLDPPLSVPFVLVHIPVNVCVSPAPRFKVPPFPFIVNAPPFTLPINVAVPAVFVIETVPVVVKPSMLCANVVPLITIGDAPAVNVPLL